LFPENLGRWLDPPILAACYVQQSRAALFLSGDMMILNRYEKQPSERKDYEVDYSEWLDGTNDTLDDTVVVVTCLTNPSDTALTVSPLTSAKSIVLWVQGGTDRAKYKLTIKVTTVANRVDESELIFTIKDY
jgi:hypothetical protein